MKRLLTLTLALMALTVFVSCGEDDAPFGDNELVIDGEVMPLVGSYYYDSDYDLSNGFNFRAEGIVVTHVRRRIVFYDDVTNNNAYISVEFYSKGETFNNGSYVVKSYNDEIDADTESFVIINGEANSEVYGFNRFEGMTGKITISCDEEEVDLNEMILKFNLSGIAYVPIILARQDGSTDGVEVNIKGQFQGEVQLD